MSKKGLRGTPYIPPKREAFIIRCFLLIFALSFLAFLSLALFYGVTSVTVPNSVKGEIYPLNLHGRLVYIDHAQHLLLSTLKWSFLIFGAVFACTGLILRYRHRKLQP